MTPVECDICKREMAKRDEKIKRLKELCQKAIDCANPHHCGYDELRRRATEQGVIQ